MAYRTDYRRDFSLFPATSQRWLAALVALLAIAVPFALTSDVTPPMNLPWRAWFPAINFALIAIVGAAAFNLLIGYTHQISLAHAAFLMIGAIVGAQMGTLWNVNFLLILIAAAAIGAVLGALVALPALRLQGLYLLVATLGIHYIVDLIYRRFLVSRFGFGSISYNTPVLPDWLGRLPFLSTDDGGGVALDTNFRWYWVLLGIAVLSLVFMGNLVRSRTGRAFSAVGQHEVAAALIGIDPARTKLIAFSVSSAFVTLSGALGSHYVGSRGEDSFPLALVLFFAIMIVIGGFSSLHGAVFGALFYYLAPVFLAWSRAELPVVRDISVLRQYGSEADLALFGILIIAVLVLRPQGLVGMWRDLKRYVESWPYAT